MRLEHQEFSSTNLEEETSELGCEIGDREKQLEHRRNVFLDIEPPLQYENLLMKLDVDKLLLLLQKTLESAAAETGKSLGRNAYDRVRDVLLGEKATLTSAEDTRLQQLLRSDQSRWGDAKSWLRYNDNRGVIVVGPSGVGKSRLVHFL